jgi:hypothetical protein
MVRRQGGKALAWALIVTGVVVLAGAGIVVLPRLKSGPNLAELKKEARAEGLAVSASDLRKLVATEDADNAAAVYRTDGGKVRRAFALDKAVSGAMNLFLKDAAMPADRQLVAKTVQRFDKSLDRLVQASKLSGCDFGFRFERGLQLPMSELIDLKYAARALCVRARLRAAAGQTGPAFSDIKAALRMSGHALRQPFLIALLLGSSTEQVAMQEFHLELSRVSRNAAGLAAAKDALTALEPMPSVRDSLRGELALFMETLDRLKSIEELVALLEMSSSGSAKPATGNGVPLSASWRNDIGATAITLWRKIFTIVPAKPRNWSELVTALERADKEVDKQASSKAIRDMVVVSFLSPLRSSGNTVGRLEAERNIAITSVRLFQERLAKGRLPESAPAAGPTSIDPIDGFPLRYRTRGNGFILYSVGLDYHDNNGSGSTSGFYRKGQDLVWEFER